MTPRTWSVDVHLSGRALAAVAVAMALLATSAQPVAASHANYAVGSSHSSDSDFGDAAELSDVTITGSGTDAAVALANKEYNVVEDSGDGTAETEITGFVGDDSDGARKSEVKVVPTTSGDFDYLNVSVVGIVNDDFGFTVDIYAVQENPDGTYGEGTLIKSGWDPDFSTGVQSIPLDTPLAASSGENWTIEFVTQSTDGDGTSEWLDLGADGDSGLTGWSSKSGKGGTIIHDRGGDVTLHDSTSKAETGTYVSQNHSASNVEKAWTNIELSNATASVEWQAWDSSTAQWQVVNSSQFSSSGNHTLDISGTSFDKWRVNVTFDKTGSNPTAQLHDEGVLVETSGPTIDNQSATPDTMSTSVQSPVDLTVSVNDSDFGIGDTLTVNYYVDGSKVGSKQVSSAGDVTYSLSDVAAGSHSWHVEVSDQYGHTTTSETFRFTTSSELKILDEENPDQLVKDDVTVTVHLFADDVVKKREVADGTVNMSGLPLNSTIVATTQADGWIDRRILIRNLTEQQEIYLLNSSSNAVSVTFDLQDKSGNFPEDTSQLYVQKALNTSNTDGLEWQTVSGDYFGADGSFPTQLLYQQRYRLIIRNAEGDRRVLGNFIPTEGGTFPVEIGKIVWDPPEGESIYANSEIRELDENVDHTYPNASKEMYVEYFDSQDKTTKLTINVSVRGNESIYSTTVYDVQSHTESIPLTDAQANESLVVNVTAERSGDDYSQTWQYGTPDDVDTGADRMWLELATQVTMLVLVGLVAGAMPKKGGLVVVPVAFGVSWMGWWNIHPAALGMMGVIALFAAARSRGGV